MNTGSLNMAASLRIPGWRVVSVYQPLSISLGSDLRPGVWVILRLLVIRQSQDHLKLTIARRSPTYMVSPTLAARRYCNRVTKRVRCAQISAGLAGRRALPTLLRQRPPAAYLSQGTRSYSLHGPNGDSDRGVAVGDECRTAVLLCLAASHGGL